MDILSQLNSPVMYLICGGIIFFVALVCVFFMVRAYRAGVAIGMDKTKMKRTITASATFAALPSVGILLGVIALSGSLGTPWSWLRLSVIGALHYETQVAEAAAEAVGLPGLSASAMTPQAFTTIALLMGVCIMWGMVFSIFFNKKYLSRLKAPKKNGLVSAYIGSYIGALVSGAGRFTFAGSWMPLAVVAVSAAVMAVFVWLAEKKNAAWVDNFSIGGSMLAGMAAAVLLRGV